MAIVYGLPILSENEVVWCSLFLCFQS